MGRKKDTPDQKEAKRLKKVVPLQQPTESEKELIQEGLNQAGTKIVQEHQDPFLKLQAETMARRLGKVDAFIDKLILEEGSDNLSPESIIQLLISKARHKAFVHTSDTYNSRVLVWLIEMILCEADAVFAITKAHLVAEQLPTT